MLFIYLSTKKGNVSDLFIKEIKLCKMIKLNLELVSFNGKIISEIFWSECKEDSSEIE